MCFFSGYAHHKEKLYRFSIGILKFTFWYSLDWWSMIELFYHSVSSQAPCCGSRVLFLDPKTLDVILVADWASLFGASQSSKCVRESTPKLLRFQEKKTQKLLWQINSKNIEQKQNNTTLLPNQPIFLGVSTFVQFLLPKPHAPARPLAPRRDSAAAIPPPPKKTNGLHNGMGWEFLLKDQFLGIACLFCLSSCFYWWNNLNFWGVI